MTGLVSLEGVPAPAKINRFLHILGRRADGRHELQTWFQLLELCDRLDYYLESRPGVRIECAREELTGPDNLAGRAASLLQRCCGASGGVRIRLHKYIPVGSGLGGGSSDAATTLLTLNRLWDAGLGTDQLAALGLELGADVPLFVRGTSAWGEGLGECLTAVDSTPTWFVVLDTGVEVATGAVFADPELTRDTPRMKIRDLRVGDGRNDCAGVVYAKYPQIAEAVSWLGERAPARLSGTGGCIFAPFASEGAARAVAATVPAEWRVHVARGCDASPLQRYLRYGG